MPKTFIPLDMYEALINSQEENNYFKVLQNIIANLGFNYCAYGVLDQSNGRVVPPQLVNNYPDTWKKLYTKRNYVKIDPTVRHGLTSTQLLLWTPEIYKVSPEFWEEAKSFGISHGVSHSQKDVYGRTGMLTFSSANNEHDIRFFNEYSKTLTWLSHAAHYFLADKLLPVNIDSPEYLFSIREKDILFWMAEGMTSREISFQLSITESAVNYHVTNILKKLSAPNKTAAIAKSIRIKLLKY